MDSFPINPIEKFIQFRVELHGETREQAIELFTKTLKRINAMHKEFVKQANP
jgi:hypothetical protein